MQLQWNPWEIRANYSRITSSSCLAVNEQNLEEDKTVPFCIAWLTKEMRKSMDKTEALDSGKRNFHMQPNTWTENRKRIKLSVFITDCNNMYVPMAYVAQVD